MPPSVKPAYYKPVIHDSHRRAAWHDYCSRCIYMVTLCKSEMCPCFGTLKAGDNLRNAAVELSETGKIVRTEIDRTPLHHKDVRVLECIIMPDHVHVLFFVTQVLSKPLGHIIQSMKAAITSRIRHLGKRPELCVFEDGFHDRILREPGQLNILIRYIRENPYRLAVRNAYPDFFQKLACLTLFETNFQAYGNLQLLDNPFKEQVIVHRNDTPEIRTHYRNLWRYTAINGGVLVSPFISADEKQIREEAETLGGKFIILTNRPFSDREKPAAHNFELCEQGRLLILAPLTGMTNSLTRARCLEMNRYASMIANANRQCLSGYRPSSADN